MHGRTGGKTGKTAVLYRRFMGGFDRNDGKSPFIHSFPINPGNGQTVTCLPICDPFWK